MAIRSYDSLEAGIRTCFGEDTKIVKRSYVGGGDINEACCLTLSNGERVFVKSNSVSNKGFFDAEEAGIEAIASTGTIKTPRLICKGTDRVDKISFLMMEMIEAGKKVKDFWEIFGRELAAMHLFDTEGYILSGHFGFTGNNYIGASKQINDGRESWIIFFRECRLEPQIRMAERYFDDSMKRSLLKLLDRLPDILVEPRKPSLLHGDLWSGNYITGNDGKAWLIDPAAYVGHAEADLAMTELFGRFSGDFYRAYEEVNPLQPGYEDRRDLYNLYHMLNHLNLFGYSYYSAVAGIVKRYV